MAEPTTVIGEYTSVTGNLQGDEDLVRVVKQTMQYTRPFETVHRPQLRPPDRQITV